MASDLAKIISERRRVLQNPDAYADELEELASLRTARHALENPYAYSDEVERFSAPINRFDGLNSRSPRPRATSKDHSWTDSEIEALARALHRELWERRHELFPERPAASLVDYLDPVVALRSKGFTVTAADALGKMFADGSETNVAGLIDLQSKEMLLSSGFSLPETRYTAAHELGHALMHKFAGMHRDRPLDGSRRSKDVREREADKFAAFFLMPLRLLTAQFEAVFGQAPFRVTEETRFALAGAVANHVHWKPRNLRELSRVLAAAPQFNGRQLEPMHRQFRVSKESLAIRTEELGLVAL